MEQSLPKEESMPVVSALEKFFYYLSCTKHSAWHLIDVTNELVNPMCKFFKQPVDPIGAEEPDLAN
jgi:hypothetical protein